MTDYLAANRRLWDELVAIHLRSEFYDVAAFKAGGCSLTPLEREEVGDVSGKSLLHLQCHFGLDTLSWARRGARVTGIDFSAEGIDAARALAAESGTQATFVQCELQEVPNAVAERFDIVFTTWGVLTWLPDIDGWARTVRECLRPGGLFYLADQHPFTYIFHEAWRGGDDPLQVARDYFIDGQPERFDYEEDYAEPGAALANTFTYEWTHSLGAIVSALAAAGLEIEFLREHPFVPWKAFAGLEKGEGAYWRMPAGRPEIPLSFSIRASARP